MARKTQLWAGGVLLLLGILLLAQRLTGNMALRYAWSALLLLVGAALLWSGHSRGDDVVESVHPAGLPPRADGWIVQDERIYTAVGHLVLDLTTAQVPDKCAAICCRGGVLDIDLRIPYDIEARLTTRAFLGAVRWDQEREEVSGRPVAVTFPAGTASPPVVTVSVEALIANVCISRASAALEEAT